MSDLTKLALGHHKMGKHFEQWEEEGVWVAAWCQRKGAALVVLLTSYAPAP
jgi:hypothetical protein